MTIVSISKESDGFSIKVKSADAGAFNLLIDTLKSFIRPELREYRPAGKQWRVEGRAAESLHKWLAYARTNLHAEVEWLDAREDEYERPPKPQRPPAKVDAYSALHLLPDAPPSLIRAAFKCLVQLHHPDKATGDTAKMQQLNEAYKQMSPAA
jgi:hypothetical protein